MIQTITAIEHDGIDERSFVMTFDVFAAPATDDLVEAAKEAARAFLTTEEGLKAYVGNCDNFNWGDFEQCVPNDICRKYGFSKVELSHQNTTVDWNELIAEPTFLVSKIQWDTDDADCEDLPSELYVPMEELLNAEETLGDVEVEELKDRIADALSDQYGFLVRGFTLY